MYAREIYTPFFRLEINIIYTQSYFVYKSDSPSFQLEYYTDLFRSMSAFEWLNVSNR